MGRKYDPWVGSGKSQPGGPPAWGTVWGSGAVREASAPMLRALLEHRQVACCCLLYGTLVAVSGCPPLVAAASGPPDTVMEALNLAAAVTAVGYGLVGILAGAYGAFCDRASSALSIITIVAVASAWFVLSVGVAGLALQWNLDPTDQSYFDGESLAGVALGRGDVLACRVVELAGGVAYLLAIAGALTFFALKARAFQRAGGVRYTGSFFRRRLGYYTCLTGVAGSAQLGLGIYLLVRFGGGPFEQPVVVSPFVVFWPEMAITVGSAQLALGAYGMGRALVGAGGRSNHFAMLAVCTAIAGVCLQVCVQAGWAAGGRFAGEAASGACLVLGLLLMPAYLDAKARGMPRTVASEDYSLAAKDAIRLARDESSKGGELAAHRV
eukprot:jgi/Tetstr1/431411/TSEL_021101.t1